MGSKNILTQEEISQGIDLSMLMNVQPVGQPSSRVTHDAVAAERPRQIEFVQESNPEESITPYYDATQIRQFRHKILKKSKQFEVVWKQDTNSLLIWSMNTQCTVLEIDYGTHETFISSECEYNTRDLRQALQSCDPLEYISDGGLIPTFVNCHHNFFKRTSPKKIIRDRTKLMLKNLFTALYIPEEEIDEVEQLNQDYFNEYTDLVSYYTTHLAKLTFKEDYVKHAIKHVDVSNIARRAHFREVYKKMHVLMNYVGYVELEYSINHNEKMMVVLEELKSQYPRWDERLILSYNRTTEIKLPPEVKREDTLGRVVEQRTKQNRYKNASPWKVKEACLNKFNNAGKWFGFSKNKMLRNFLRGIEVNWEIVTRLPNMESLKTSEDIQEVYDVLLNLCAVTKSRQFIAFANCLEVQESILTLPTHYKHALEFMENHNNLYLFSSLKDIKNRAHFTLLKVATILGKKFHYTGFKTLNKICFNLFDDTDVHCENVVF